MRRVRKAAPVLHMAAHPAPVHLRSPAMFPYMRPRPGSFSKASPGARPASYLSPRDCLSASTGASNKRSTTRGRCCSLPAAVGRQSWCTLYWRPFCGHCYGQRYAAPSCIPSSTHLRVYAAGGFPGYSARDRPLSWPLSCYPSALSTTVWRPWGSWWPGDCHCWPGRLCSMCCTGLGAT